MTDVLTRSQRSKCMSRIRSKNTKPEKKVRLALHALGYRYRLHVALLPGHPDIVFPKAKVAIFVHGCFWHMHRCRFGRVVPKNNALFWAAKRQGNVNRDRRNLTALKKLGWRSLVTWECRCRKPGQFVQEVKRIVSTLERKSGKIKLK